VARSVISNVILKYCEILDEFVKVRVFTDDDIAELLKIREIPNRGAYQQMCGLRRLPQCRRPGGKENRWSQHQCDTAKTNAQRHS